MKKKQNVHRFSLRTKNSLPKIMMLIFSYLLFQEVHHLMSTLFITLDSMISIIYMTIKFLTVLMSWSHSKVEKLKIKSEKDMCKWNKNTLLIRTTNNLSSTTSFIPLLFPNSLLTKKWSFNTCTTYLTMISSKTWLQWPPTSTQDSVY